MEYFFDSKWITHGTIVYKTQKLKNGRITTLFMEVYIRVCKNVNIERFNNMI